jgi:hypothetical protein
MQAGNAFLVKFASGVDAGRQHHANRIASAGLGRRHPGFLTVHRLLEGQRRSVLYLHTQLLRSRPDHWE